MNYDLHIRTKKAGTIVLTGLNPAGDRRETEAVRVEVDQEEGLVRVMVAPRDPQDRLIEVAHRVTIDLRNFHQVIVPDSGRQYPFQTQLVGFWGSSRESHVGNLCVPLFIFTGQDHCTSLGFGVIGSPYETRFRCLQPFSARALSAFTRKLSLEISRGGESHPVPEEELTGNGSLTEYVYFRDYPQGSGQSWPLTLREFCQYEKILHKIEFPIQPATLDPLWCSWTDWHSDDVDEKVIAEQVEEGLKLGIRNFIIDDGWFGPGLDSDRSVELNIGDWEADPAKISDLPGLSRRIRELGGRAIIWCAPHAVGSLADCRQERLPLLVRDREQQLVATSNQFNILCLRSPEARDAMADICVRLAVEFETDGAKYDLFNCIPPVECCSDQHAHDTDSMLVALRRLLALIRKRVIQVKPDYLIELKQNYGGTFLSRFGTMMRAGDTPYANEGNFLRTVHVQAYNQFAINDYQTITPFDNLTAAATIVIKMMAVGIPAYSMDLKALPSEHRQMLRFYHQWYTQNLSVFSSFRTPLDPDLNVWRAVGDDREIYFLVNYGGSLEPLGRDTLTIVNGSCRQQVRLQAAAADVYTMQLFDGCGNPQPSRQPVSLGGNSEDTLIKLPTGWMAILKKQS